MTTTMAYWPAADAELVREQTIGAALRDAAREHPDTPALVEGLADPAARRRWSYAELLADAECTARALLRRFEPGERVAVWANNIPEWLLLQLGAALAGLTLVTVDPALRVAELGHVLGDARAAGIVMLREYRGNPMEESLHEVRPTLAELRDVLFFEEWAAFAATGATDRALPAVAPGDPAQIQYTSGTTGRPKGVVLRHSAVVNSAGLSYPRMFDLRPGEALVNAMPLFHTAGSVMGALAPIVSHGTHVLMPAFDPAAYLRLVEQERSVLFGGVPTMLLALLAHPALATTDLSSVRVALAGGAAVPPELVRRVESELGVPMSIIYAQTEASPGITMTDPFHDSAPDRAETLGRPLPGVEVRIADAVDGGVTVAAGVVGELCTRGYHVMAGYVDAPEQTSRAIDADGWLHTGDLAIMDERGYCRIQGRLKEMIIRGGENVFPREIELVLLTHPGVLDAAVVGVPDDRWGEQVVAFVRGRPDLTAADLDTFCRARLAGHKVPRGWRFVQTFPLTGSGKVRKDALAQAYATDARPEAP